MVVFFVVQTACTGSEILRFDIISFFWQLPVSFFYFGMGSMLFFQLRSTCPIFYLTCGFFVGGIFQKQCIILTGGYRCHYCGWSFFLRSMMLCNPLFFFLGRSTSELRVVPMQYSIKGLAMTLSNNIPILGSDLKVPGGWCVGPPDHPPPSSMTT